MDIAEVVNWAEVQAAGISIFADQLVVSRSDCRFAWGSSEKATRNRVEVTIFSSLRQFHRAISPREIASLCGPPFTEVDIFEVGDEMGLKGAYSRYGRLEARLIVMKLIARASEPEVVRHLLGAYSRLAGRGENDVPV